MLLTELHRDQVARWPSSGQRILAQFTPEHIVVYQAYRPSIAAYAVEHQRFGGDFRFNRMSWIKPNFLWMMYRSGWATKQDQEVVLALYLPREVFEAILSQAVHSTFAPTIHSSREAWARAVANSDVRLQWDPDHSPSGGPLARRAIQLGLRGAALQSFGAGSLLRIEDITNFVAEQRQVLSACPAQLVTPREDTLPIPLSIATRLGVDPQFNGWA